MLERGGGGRGGGGGCGEEEEEDGEIKWTASEARGSPAEEGGGVGVSVEQVTTTQDPRTFFLSK